MNILPFVLLFLVLFGMASQSIFEKHAEFFYAHSRIHNFIFSQKDLLNTEQKHYRAHAARSEIRTNAQGSPPSPRPATFGSKIKENSPPQEKLRWQGNSPPQEKLRWQRLDISFLLTGENKELKKIFSSLVTLFYKDLFTQKELPTFVNLWIDGAKKHFNSEGNLFLEKMSFEKSHVQEIWYQMLKGSQNYSFENTRGYPSILDLIECYSKGTIKKIPLPQARAEIVAALTNYSLAQDWQKLQINKVLKNQEIAEKKFKELLQKYHIQLDTNTEELISYQINAPYSKETIIKTEKGFLKKRIYLQ